MRKSILICLVIVLFSCKGNDKNVLKNNNTRVKTVEVKVNEDKYDKKIDTSEFAKTVLGFNEYSSHILNVTTDENYLIYYNNAELYEDEALGLMKNLAGVNQVFVISLMRGLTFKDYMRFSNKVFDMYNEGYIEIDVFIWLFTYEKTFVNHFYDNVSSEEVQSFKKRILSSENIPVQEKTYFKDKF